MTAVHPLPGSYRQPIIPAAKEVNREPKSERDVWRVVVRKLVLGTYATRQEAYEAQDLASARFPEETVVVLMPDQLADPPVRRPARRR